MKKRSFEEQEQEQEQTSKNNSQTPQKRVKWSLSHRNSTTTTTTTTTTDNMLSSSIPSGSSGGSGIQFGGGIGFGSSHHQSLGFVDFTTSPTTTTPQTPTQNNTFFPPTAKSVTAVSSPARPGVVVLQQLGDLLQGVDKQEIIRIICELAAQVPEAGLEERITDLLPRPTLQITLGILSGLEKKLLEAIPYSRLGMVYYCCYYYYYLEQ